MGVNPNYWGVFVVAGWEPLGTISPAKVRIAGSLGRWQDMLDGSLEWSKYVERDSHF